MDNNLYKMLLEIKKEQAAAKANNVLPKVREIIADTINEIIYPVGSIISSFDDVNPGERENEKSQLPGTWERFGEGRVIVGVSGDDSQLNAAGKTGGEKYHTITTQEMPSHTHQFTTGSTGGNSIPLRGYGAVLGSGNVGWRFGSGGSQDATGIASLPSHSHSGTTDSNGGGQAFNKMPPYITAYFWRRTA